MSLKRTASGLQSLHLFFKVDLVAYCEGARSLRKEEVLKGEGDEGTPDAVFWNAALQPLQRRGKKIHIKSVGSKKVLHAITEDLRAQGAESVLVCLDMDFDDFMGSRMGLPFVFYTHGYSWENDVTQIEILESMFFDLVANTNANRRIWQDAREQFAIFSKEVKQLTEAEIELCRKEAGALFDRERPAAPITVGKNRPPELNKDVTRNRLAKLGLKRLPRRTIHLCPEYGSVCTFGKLVARFCFHLLLYSVKRINQKHNLTYETFIHLAASCFARRMKALQGNVERYFSQQCARIP